MESTYLPSEELALDFRSKEDLYKLITIDYQIFTNLASREVLATIYSKLRHTVCSSDTVVREAGDPIQASQGMGSIKGASPSS